jgi:hypothetical protein
MQTALTGNRIQENKRLNGLWQSWGKKNKKFIPKNSFICSTFGSKGMLEFSTETSDQRRLFFYD